MAPTLLIDGYNVIHRLPRYKSLIDDLDRARAHLIEDTAGYAAFSGYKAIVVFDAHLSHATKANKSKVLGIEVCFTGQGQTADAYIERLCTSEPSSDTYKVVTLDRIEHLIVASQGVERITPEDYERMLSEGRADAKTESGSDLNRFEVSSRLDEEVIAALRKMISEGEKP